MEVSFEEFRRKVEASLSLLAIILVENGLDANLRDDILLDGILEQRRWGQVDSQKEKR